MWGCTVYVDDEIVVDTVECVCRVEGKGKGTETKDVGAVLAGT
jgi:hypothetical protein